MDAPLPRLYTDLAGWFHLLTPPEDYEEEATFYLGQLRAAAARPLRTLLELGSGGGNNASHLKNQLDLTLVDLSPAMLEVSRSLNPECEHIVGDMRTVRLGRVFDAVFVHDAVCYITSRDDLAAVIATVRAHCAPGGAVLLAPDFVTETFRAQTSREAHGDGRRRLSYEEHTYDPDPADTEYVAEMTYRLEAEGEPVQVIRELHHEGLFPTRVWRDLLTDAGFVARPVPFDHSGVELDSVVFVGSLPGV